MGRSFGFVSQSLHRSRALIRVAAEVTVVAMTWIRAVHQLFAARILVSTVVWNYLSVKEHVIDKIKDKVIMSHRAQL